MLEILKYLPPSLAPQKVLNDFKKAFIRAVSFAFPNAEVKGCYFHSCHSPIRKVDSACLEMSLNKTLELSWGGGGDPPSSLAALALLPSNEVGTVFHALTGSFPDEAKLD